MDSVLGKSPFQYCHIYNCFTANIARKMDYSLCPHALLGSLHVRVNMRVFSIASVFTYINGHCTHCQLARHVGKPDSNMATE